MDNVQWQVRQRSESRRKQCRKQSNKINIPLKVDLDGNKSRIATTTITAVEAAAKPHNNYYVWMFFFYFDACIRFKSGCSSTWQKQEDKWKYEKPINNTHAEREKY